MKALSSSSNKTVLFGILVLVVVVGLSLYFFLGEDLSESSEGATWQVQKQDFSLEVVERGIVAPARISPISSKISSNQAKIIWLAKEGEHVKQGMLVARFDEKPFLDRLHKAEQAHTDAKAAYHGSEKLLFIQQEEEAGKIEEAARKVEIANIEANNIKNGSGPLKRRVLVQKLNQAQRGLEISKNEFDDISALLKKGHINAREKDKASDSLETAQEQLSVAQAELDNFDTYAWPQMLREAELLVSGAKSNRDRVKRTSELLIGNKLADVEKYRRTLVNKEQALERARQDIVNCKIFSPTDGILLYSVLPRENTRRKIQIGDSVWVGQTFMEVPDTTELIAEIQVREIDVANIAPGMDAVIEVDAFPEKQFTGKVLSVASLAAEDDENSSIRRFYCRVGFTGETGKIHVGMSVTTRITYQEIHDSTVVPISSLAYRDHLKFVRKIVGGEATDVSVELGARGDFWVEVLSGLEPGDTIVKDYK